MNLKKLDNRITGLSRAAKKKLLAKHLVLTNDKFIWLQETQKEICNVEKLSEIPQQTDQAIRLFVRLTT